MNVLVACEFSGVVRDAFTRRGHYATSVDLLPSETEGVHYTGNIKTFLTHPTKWDLMIAHPPCTHIAVSGARWFKGKEREQKEAIEFFMYLANANIPRICIENPVCIMSTIWRKPDQTVQPWMFGHRESKKTCLWLKGLPLLRPTNVLTLPTTASVWDNQTPSGQNKLGPSADRWKERSRTYVGIADAMAEQWGNLCD